MALPRRDGRTALPAERDRHALDLTVPAAGAEHIASIRAAARGFAEDHDAERPADVALCVTEAATNVVLHAYRDGPGPLHLRGAVDAKFVYFVVADEGCGLVPRPESSGLGAGLRIIALTARKFALEPGEPAGTVARMGFERDGDGRRRA